MAARTVGPELRDAMKQLRLGQLLASLPERITLAEKESLPIEDFLLGLFTDEIERQHGAAAARRADAAGLDPDMVFERWDKAAKVTCDRRVLQELSSLRFVEARRNVVILGPVGVGKTFVASALGHVACSSGFQGPFSSCRRHASVAAPESSRQFERGVDGGTLHRRLGHRR